MQRLLAALWPALLLAGCVAPPQNAAGPATACVEPRPQVCTMEYNPVCALKADGSRATYSSGCNACADSAVTGFDPGPCDTSP
jgi:hypothetical protein